MKEKSLRKWHRYLGVVLAIFIIFQAGTGLFLNFGQLSIPHAHAQGTPSTHDRPSTVSNTAMAIHHGGGFTGAIYRILVGTGILVQTVLGTLIYLRIRSRGRKWLPKL